MPLGVTTLRRKPCPHQVMSFNATLIQLEKTLSEVVPNTNTSHAHHPDTHCAIHPPICPPIHPSSIYPSNYPSLYSSTHSPAIRSSSHPSNNSPIIHLSSISPSIREPQQLLQGLASRDLSEMSESGPIPRAKGFISHHLHTRDAKGLWEGGS